MSCDFVEPKFCCQTFVYFFLVRSGAGNRLDRS